MYGTMALKTKAMISFSEVPDTGPTVEFTGVIVALMKASVAVMLLCDTEA